jgi:hypothetical protein
MIFEEKFNDSIFSGVKNRKKKRIKYFIGRCESMLSRQNWRFNMDDVRVHVELEKDPWRVIFKFEKEQQLRRKGLLFPLKEIVISFFKGEVNVTLVSNERYIKDLEEDWYLTSPLDKPPHNSEVITPKIVRNKIRESLGRPPIE